MENTLGPAQVCKKFDISKSTLLRWEEQGLVPAPNRNLYGYRRYTQEHCQAIAQFIQSRQLRRRYERILSKEDQNTRAKLELRRLGEQNALFKFVNLQDSTGLIELREYSPLQPSTINQLLKVATDKYDPSEDQFWDILDVIRETSRPTDRKLRS